MTPSPAPPGIDPLRVTNWLVAVAGVAPPVTYSAIGDGQSNFSYLASDAAGDQWVLRRPPLGKLSESAHDVAREFHIQSRLAATDVPVPRMVALSEDPAICDVPLVLMEYVDGVVLGDAETVGDVSPELRRAAGLSIGANLTRVHDVDLDATGLAGLASHAPYAQRQIRRWLRQWEEVKTRENALVANLAARFRTAAPAQRELALVHGDYHLMNVVLDPQTGAVRAILDWELCTLGDPLADLGSLLAYWPERDDDRIFTMFSVTLAPGFPTRDELVTAYVRASGRDASDLGFWHALGYWKLATIVEGVRRRSIDEPRNGEPVAAADVDGLLERAHQTARQAGI